MPRRPMDPLVIHHHAGDIKILVSSANTGGAMSMIETVTAPRGGPSWHNHSREDETFYVVSGTAEVRILEETFLCEAGDRVFGPRNLFHTYRNVGKAELKMVIAYTPGGFEQSFADATAMLAEGKDQNDIGRMLAEKYGLTRGHLPA
jgi:quercetin dioxygenase-like cupin family protein